MRCLQVMLIACLVVGVGVKGRPAFAGAPNSGLAKDQEMVPWNPIHVAGPDRGTNACPICTYLERPGVVIFGKDGPNVAALATQLEKLIGSHQNGRLKGFVVILDTNPERMKKLATSLKLEKIALCYPDPKTRDQDLKAYKINAAASNTVLIYKDYKVAATFVNLEAKEFAKVEEAVRRLPR